MQNISFTGQKRCLPLMVGAFARRRAPSLRGLRSDKKKNNNKNNTLKGTKKRDLEKKKKTHKNSQDGKNFLFRTRVRKNLETGP